MKKLSRSILPYIVLLALVVIWAQVVYAASTYSVLRDPNGLPAKDGAVCTVSSVAAVTIGDDISTQVLAASTNRAWARISVGNNATNTVFASFDEGAAATLNNGIGLNTANTGGASSTPYIDFGITTPFPYNGAVTAITNFGTTTVLVTECSY